MTGTIIGENSNADSQDTWAQVIGLTVVAITTASLNDISDPAVQFTADYWVDCTGTAPQTVPSVGDTYDVDFENFHSLKGIVIDANIDSPDAAQVWVGVVGTMVTAIEMASTNEIKDFDANYVTRYSADYWVNISIGEHTVYGMSYVYDPIGNSFSVPPTDGISDLSAKILAVHTALADARSFADAMTYKYNIDVAATEGYNAAISAGLLPDEASLWTEIVGYIQTNGN